MTDYRSDLPLNFTAFKALLWTSPLFLGCQPPFFCLFIASLAIPFLPDKDGKTIRWYALIVGLIDFAIIVTAFYTSYDIGAPGLQLVESYTWVPALDLKWSVGVDGLSMPLVLLTGFITTLAILASWPVTLKPRLFYFLMLAMYSGQLGVFAVQDMLLFFFMWELELIPVYLLLSIWGG